MHQISGRILPVLAGFNLERSKKDAKSEKVNLARFKGKSFKLEGQSCAQIMRAMYDYSIDFQKMASLPIKRGLSLLKTSSIELIPPPLTMCP